MPYFWSDQFGLRLQHVRHADDPAHVEIEGDTAAFTAYSAATKAGSSPRWRRTARAR